MRRFILTILLFAFSLQAYSQTTENARILERDESFVMISKSGGTHHVHVKVQVMNEKGEAAADFFIFTDSFRSLTDFKGELETGSGAKTKITKKDLQTISISDGIAGEDFMTVFSPDAPYPYTVTYDYSINYHNGILSFPVFSPLKSDGTRLVNATYTLQLPKGTEILSHADLLSYSEDKSGKKDIYRWEAKNIPPVVEEYLMPDIKLPLLYALPTDFVYGGVPGKQTDWEGYGAWLYSLLEGTDILDETEIQKARDMVADCKDDFQKVRTLYAYLREKTRYVSIQLGIGGLKPMPASSVAQTGYGDCKALSNYFRSLLKAVGIESDYFVLSTDVATLLPDIPAAGELDHAMLAVPLQEKGDTLFVECTDPRLPLGYRHEDVAGHQIILITPEGGKLTRVGDYPDSLRKTILKTDVRLHGDGSAYVSAVKTFYLDECEGYIDFAQKDAQVQRRRLTGGWDLQVDDVKLLSVSDNFQDYETAGRAFCPEVGLTFSMTASKYANKTGNRLFVPANPVAKKLDYQRTERVNDLYQSYPFTLTDEIVLHVPEGFKIEKIPADTDLDAEWGRLVSTFTVDGSEIRIVQQFTAKPFSESKDRYGDYRDFARKVNRIYGASIVLVSQD